MGILSQLITTYLVANILFVNTVCACPSVAVDPDTPRAVTQRTDTPHAHHGHMLGHQHAASLPSFHASPTQTFPTQASPGHTMHAEGELGSLELACISNACNGCELVGFAAQVEAFDDSPIEHSWLAPSNKLLNPVLGQFVRLDLPRGPPQQALTPSTRFDILIQ